MDECLILTEAINKRTEDTYYPYCQITQESTSMYCAGFLDGINVLFRWNRMCHDAMINDIVGELLYAYDMKTNRRSR